jgi:class 3 adenylate cyclase/tetratricopeptide (TPR) repeat protein
MDRLQALAHGADLPDRGTGSALFADLSGFTPLSEALARTFGARRGAEETSATLDRVYGALIEQVDRFRGSVIGFSGDAITCWFDADDTGRAVACGLAMRDAIAGFEAIANGDQPPISLGVKVAVASGPVRMFRVGDPAIGYFAVIAGSTVQRLAAAEEQARSSEVVVDTATAEQLGSRVTVGQWRGSDSTRIGVVDAIAEGTWEAWESIDQAALLEPDLRPWVLRQVRERLVEGQSALLSELRPAVSVFLRFGGIDYEGADAGQRLDAYVRWTQGVVAARDGALVDLTIGDKGSYYSIVFGAPIAHDDDALRAVAAALELRATPAELDFVGPVQIGVSRGRVYAGTFGAPSRRAYGVLGNDVNAAARLMQKAEPGQVIVSERIARAVRDRFEVRDLGAVRVKGFRDEVEVFELLGQARAPVATPAPTESGSRGPAAVVGRDAELSAIAAAIEAADRGDTSLTVLSGAPGAGKSLLVHAATEAARARGLRVLRGVASPVAQGSLYMAWQAIFDDLFGTQGRMPSADDVERILAPLDEPDRRFGSLLQGVLSGIDGDTTDTAWMSPDARQENTLRLLESLFARHRGTEPVLLVLDDVQWLDSASWALLARIARTAGRMAILLATRPATGARKADLGALLDSQGGSLLALEPLAAGDTLRLVARALGTRSVPEEVERFILGRAEGNPFFSLELAYALRDAGLLEIVGEEGRLAAGADLGRLEFPDTIDGVIAVRLDQLSSAEQTILKVGSVLSQSFTELDLRELAPSEMGTLEAPLVRLSELDILVADRGNDPVAYGFRHVLIRDAVYGRLLHAQRRDLHTRAAQYLERVSIAAGARQDAVLAYHWEEAGAPNRAIDHLEPAGESALRDGAFRESAAFLDRALALADGRSPAAAVPRERATVPAPERRARWEWQAAQAHYRLGDLDLSRALAEAAVATFDRAIPTGGPRLFSAIGRQALRQVLHRARASAFVDRAPLGERERIRLAVRAYFNLAEVYYLGSETARSAYAAVRGLNLAERAGPSLELVEAYGALCIISGLIGRHGFAERYGRLGIDTARQVDLPYARAIILHQLCLYHSGTGPADRLFRDYAEAMGLFGQVNDKGRLRDCVALAGIAAYLFGRLDDAERLLGDVAAGLEASERSLAGGWAFQWLGATLLRRGDADAALDHLTRAVRHRNLGGLDITSISSEGLTALALLRLGRRDEAEAAADRTRSLIEATGGKPTGHPVLDGYVAIAELSIATWDQATDADERRRREDQTATAVRYLAAYRKTFPIGEPALRLYRGELRWRQGRHDDALSNWRASLAASERLDMRHDAARAHELLGAHLSQDAPEGRVHREAAMAAYAAMGIAP